MHSQLLKPMEKHWRETLQEWLDQYDAMCIEIMVREEVARELWLRGIVVPPKSKRQGTFVNKLVEIIRQERIETDE